MQPNIQNSFLNNKYTKTYIRITERAKDRIIPFGYTEKHHIIPKCKPFCGPNTKENLVSLSFKEHLVCHHLLLKMCKTKLEKMKMYYAFNRMGQTSSNNKRIINLKSYDRIKTYYYELGLGRIPWNKGKKGNNLKKETCIKMSLSRIGNKNNLGNFWSKETYNKNCCNYKITFPDGHTEIVNNLRQFCKYNNLNSGNMNQVALGNFKQHKGFKATKL
jgi:hypothetical protein